MDEISRNALFRKTTHRTPFYVLEVIILFGGACGRKSKGTEDFLPFYMWIQFVLVLLSFVMFLFKLECYDAILLKTKLQQEQVCKTLHIS